MTSDSPQYDVAAVMGLLASMRRVQTSSSYEATLQAIVDEVVAVAGFEVAVINTRSSGGDFHASALAADPDSDVASLTLDDLPSLSNAEMVAELALGTALGDLVFVGHDIRDPTRDGYAWVPDIPVDDSPGAWHPHDALYAPLRDLDGELIAVLSVDLPRNRRVPDQSHCEILEMFASYASVAFSQAVLSARLRESEEEFRLAFESAVNGIALLHRLPGGRVKGARVNQALCAMLGYEVEDFTRLKLRDIVHPDNDPEILDTVLVRDPALLDGYFESDMMLTRSDGDAIWVSCKSSFVRRDETELTSIVSLEDISERRLVESRLQAQAKVDALTGVFNRHELDATLARQAEEVEATRHPGAALFCDIDQFKQINDSFGHAIGDLVLVEVSRRLRNVVRAGDTILRLGGDEFLIVAVGLGPEEAAQLADRMAAAVHVPMFVDGHTISVDLSIGVATAHPGDDDGDDLLRKADRAMYLDKNRSLR